MSRLVTCPTCRRSLRIAPQMAGRPVRCPACRTVFHPPAEEPLADDLQPETIQKDVPLIEPDIQRPPRSLIALETHPAEVSDASEAHALLAAWKLAMPEVPPAYVPSGRVPVSALGFMSLGSGLGAICGLLAGLILGVFTWGVFWVLDGLWTWLATSTGYSYDAFNMLALLAGLLAVAFTFGTLGWVAGRSTTLLGRIGKNRNPHLAALFSFVATLLALVLLFTTQEVFGLWFGPEFVSSANERWLFWLFVGIEGLGGILALVVGTRQGYLLVSSAKFCEICEEFMQETSYPTLGLGALKGLTYEMHRGAIAEAAACVLVQPGKEGKVALFCCLNCGRGYVEVTAMFKCSYKTSQHPAVVQQNWLTVSMELDHEQVEGFRSGAMEQ